MGRTGIYVRKGEEHVGPFCSRQDAERFLLLMELFGTSSEGIEIVELGTAKRPRSKWCHPSSCPPLLCRGLSEKRL